MFGCGWWKSIALSMAFLRMVDRESAEVIEFSIKFVVLAIKGGGG